MLMRNHKIAHAADSEKVSRKPGLTVVDGISFGRSLSGSRLAEMGDSGLADRCLCN